MSNKSASLAGHQPLILLVSLQWEGAWCGGFAGCFRSGGSRVGLKPGSEPGRKQREEAAPAFLERRPQWFRPARAADVTPARRPGCLGASRRRVSRRVAGGAADGTGGVESAVSGCGDLVAAPLSEPGPAPRSASSRRAGTFGAGVGHRQRGPACPEEGKEKAVPEAWSGSRETRVPFISALPQEKVPGDKPVSLVFLTAYLWARRPSLM
ncbi:zinc finger protein 501 isoform X3 [Felis catus]|uniref:zinc finger protein 501 isoform X3 n=1 Tax=Felis catus TaxID=9685 RepID=UPI001D1A17A0|nr:zinc finger protein 501 isoform X3 [Felis catus]